MSEPFLAEIRMVGFTFAPRGWAFCDGQIMPINQNQSLYSLLGTTYGGDGRTTFALPDLRGRIPIHVGAVPGGQNHTLGQRSGEESHTLTSNEMPSHTHTALASAASGNSPIATNQVLATTDAVNIYDDNPALVNMSGDAITNTGGSQSHNNMMPSLVVNFCIALQGLFPSRN